MCFRVVVPQPKTSVTLHHPPPPFTSPYPRRVVSYRWQHSFACSQSCHFHILNTNNFGRCIYKIYCRQNSCSIGVPAAMAVDSIKFIIAWPGHVLLPASCHVQFKRCINSYDKYVPYMPINLGRVVDRKNYGINYNFKEEQ